MKGLLASVCVVFCLGACAQTGPGAAANGGRGSVTAYGVVDSAVGIRR